MTAHICLPTLRSCQLIAISQTTYNWTKLLTLSCHQKLDVGFGVFSLHLLDFTKLCNRNRKLEISKVPKKAKSREPAY